MEKAPLNRRGFLRLCVVIASGAVLAACEEVLKDIPTATPVAPTRTPTTATKVRLIGEDQDVWVWIKTVKVEISGDCESVVVKVNGREFEAQSDDTVFTADVTLSAGENQVGAVCRQSDGAETESNMLSYTERLRQVPRAVIHIAVEMGDIMGGEIILEGRESRPAESEGLPIINYLWSARAENPAPIRMPDGELTGEFNNQSISIIPPTTDGEYYLSLRVKDEAGREDTSTTYFVVENGQPSIPDYDTESPS